VVSIIESGVPLYQIDEREIYWIKYYRENGFKLLNLTDGGFGHRGFKQSQETIKKRADKLKGRKCSDETKQFLRDRQLIKFKKFPHLGHDTCELALLILLPLWSTPPPVVPTYCVNT
jgi:hypothetical protein